jgi:hypothetical protein
MKEIGKDIKVKDVVEGIAKSVISTVPFVNNFTQIVETVKGNVLQRRYEKWQGLVEQRLSELSQEILSKLGNNECFATTLIKTTELAAKTNSKKMEYLANAVKYFAESETDEDTLIILLNCIDKYTLSHILILKYLKNPSTYSNGKEYMFGGGIFTYFDDCYPKFNKQLRDIILRELYRDGMVNIDSDATMSRSGMEAKRTTDLGDLFITIFGVEDENK